MILRSSFRVRGTRIDYGYNTQDDTHSVWFAGDGKGSVSGVTAGEAINAIWPYSGSTEIMDLVKWLSR